MTFPQKKMYGFLFLPANPIIHAYSLDDEQTAVISTADLKDKGDKLHFNSKELRIMGQRFADAYIKEFK